MPIEFRLQELGENITTADVVSILVKAGDPIQKDQPVMELETEKAVFEVPSMVAGTVKEIRVKVGDKIKVGQVLMVVEGEGGKKETGDRRQEIGEKGKKAEGRSQESGGGKGDEKREKEGGKKETGVRSQESEGEKKTLGAGLKPARSSGGRNEDLPASPLVRRLAREMGVDLTQVSVSGERITVDDVKNHIQSQSVGASANKSERTPAPTVPLPDFTKWGPVERKPMSNVRRSTAQHISQAWRDIPHVTQFDQADITELEQLRKRFAKRVEAAGGHLSLTAIILKVAASALKVFPQMNASVDMEKEEIIYKNYFHIGIAVDTERGLLVPVIRDVDQKNILDLSIELSQMTEKARNKKLTLEDMQGASFTVTNLGNIGGSHFTPIIHWPEAAILGVGRASVQAVWTENKWEARTMLPLSLSYDHRLIDGADGARFLRWLADAVQEPFLMDLEG